MLLISLSSPSLADSPKHVGETVLENAVTPDGIELGKLTLRYKLTVFLGEGVVRYVLAWEPPHELISLGSVTLHAQVIQGGAPLDAWISCSPMIPKPHKGFSWDFPGSPDWDEFFFTAAGEFLTPAQAKAIYKKDFVLGNLRLVDALAHLDTAGHPLYPLAGRTAVRHRDAALTDLETAIETATPEHDYTTGTLTGWQFDKVIRWTQGGRGKVETWQTKHLGRKFSAVRLTMEFLPTGHPLDEKPHDYANVSLNINYPFLGEKKKFSFKLREGETWITLWETPPSPHEQPAFFVNAQADRAMTGKLKDEAKPEDAQANVAPAAKPALDPFADPTGEPANPAQSTPPATNPFATADTPATAAAAPPVAASKSTDPFQRASDALAEKQRQAEAAREADLIARGVANRVYLVVETSRHIYGHNIPMPDLGSIITLSTSGFQDRMRNDPAFRAQVEARRKREAAERAAKNARTQARVNDEYKRLQAQLDARSDNNVFSLPLEVAISERARTPLTLSDDEEKKLDTWLYEIRLEVLPNISLEGEFHRAEVSIKHHLFSTRGEAEAFVQGKPTRELPQTFRF